MFKVMVIYKIIYKIFGLFNLLLLENYSML